MTKIHKKTNYLQHISSASHTVETTDKSVLSLCKLFAWQSKIKHLLTFGDDIDIACKKQFHKKTDLQQSPN